jgi:hypothetical protein
VAAALVLVAVDKKWWHCQAAVTFTGHDGHCALFFFSDAKIDSGKEDNEKKGKLALASVGKNCKWRGSQPP